MRTTCACGASWTGNRIEHCTKCHQTFSGTSAGDRHRIGDHTVTDGPNRRRCLSIDEMRAKGMATNERGVWTNGGISPFAAARVDPESLSRVEVGSWSSESANGAQIQDFEGDE